VSTFYEAKSVNYHKHNKLGKNGGGTSVLRKVCEEVTKGRGIEFSVF
jgi:hypothetical protein